MRKQIQDFSSNGNQISVLGKFGKRLLIERNLGNNCLMIWGRNIKRENVVKVVAWMILQWSISESEIQKAAQELK